MLIKVSREETEILQMPGVYPTRSQLLGPHPMPRRDIPAVPHICLVVPSRVGSVDWMTGCQHAIASD